MIVQYRNANQFPENHNALALTSNGIPHTIWRKENGDLGDLEDFKASVKKRIGSR